MVVPLRSRDAQEPDITIIKLDVLHHAFEPCCCQIKTPTLYCLVKFMSLAAYHFFIFTMAKDNKKVTCKFNIPKTTTNPDKELR
jgi:hypothetical protein